MTTGRPSIFVSIASYRDPECQHTVCDLFQKAAHPERVTVGICWQYVPGEDHDCFRFPPPYPAQVRELRYDNPADWKGGCWARAQAHGLRRDEDYVLQIDAHMHFVPGWDDALLDILRQCPSQRAILSSMPPQYTPPDKLQDCTGCLSITCVRALNTHQGLQPVSLGGFIRRFEHLPHRGPLISPFMVGNFLFAPAQAFQEVPYDPHIYFRGQELVMSARLWTHGWDIYQPNRIVIYHDWEAKPRGPSPDYKNVTPQAMLARQRVWHVLGLEPARDMAALVDIERYGMGGMRPLSDYWGFAGIDVRKNIIMEKAAKSCWTPYQPLLVS